jgi:hypothetical protein
MPVLKFTVLVLLAILNLRVNWSRWETKQDKIHRESHRKWEKKELVLGKRPTGVQLGV